MESDLKVKLEVFEGPLDLLLYLVKKDEVDIYDISIERITSQYLEYLEAFEVLHIEIAGEFLVMAANLLYIKSRTLLPKDQQMPDEETEEEDPRWELIRQLIEYRKFKEAASHLRDQEELQAALFPRAVSLDPAHAPVLDETMMLGDVGIFDLINAFQKALKRLPVQEKPGEIREETYTVTDRINHLMYRIDRGVSVRFEELFGEATTRNELVVTFLALLELIRMKQFRVRQEEQFGEIWLDRTLEGEEEPTEENEELQESA
ncbi:MAG: chromosome segregation protein ScpA [Proteobacteria bacterium]|nr:chromosome segregation protein ScpA [Pseudomonadota bacterium]